MHRCFSFQIRSAETLGWIGFFFCSHPFHSTVFPMLICEYMYKCVCVHLRVQGSNSIRIFFFFDCLIFSSTLLAINHSWTWIWLLCRAFGKILFVVCHEYLFFFRLFFFFFFLHSIFCCFLYILQIHRLKIVTLCNGVTKKNLKTFKCILCE